MYSFKYPNVTVKIKLLINRDSNFSHKLLLLLLSLPLFGGGGGAPEEEEEIFCPSVLVWSVVPEDPLYWVQKTARWVNNDDIIWYRVFC